MSLEFERLRYYSFVRFSMAATTTIIANSGIRRDQRVGGAYLPKRSYDFEKDRKGRKHQQFDETPRCQHIHDPKYNIPRRRCPRPIGTPDTLSQWLVKDAKSHEKPDREWILLWDLLIILIFNLVNITLRFSLVLMRIALFLLHNVESSV